MQNKNKLLLVRVILFLALFFVFTNFFRQKTPESGAVFEIRSDHPQAVRSFKLKELLCHPALKKLRLKQDPVYKNAGPEFYLAIPLRLLFGGMPIADQATLHFRCKDGFSAPISKENILNHSEKKAQAYLAIEDPSKPWPKLEPGRGVGSAGPFLLIWEKAELSGITQEEWPFQLQSFEIRTRLEVLFPEIFPKLKVSSSPRVFRGLKVFQKHCFACHQMNGAGDGKIGPDLNLPMSPIEYFQEKALLQFIRKPKSVRSWAASSMPSFSESTLAEGDLKDLVLYLKQMKKEKLRAQPKSTETGHSSRNF